jgi:hypothetical protein
LHVIGHGVILADAETISRATDEPGEFGIALGQHEGYLLPVHPGCDLVPFNTDPPDPLLAIATDLLAQAEARHRTATRLEYSIRQLSRGSRDRSSVSIEHIREHLRAMHDLTEAERTLLDELERELSGASR